MARQVRRQVKRQGGSGRQALVREYNARSWYDLPGWAKDWLAANGGWIVFWMTLFFTPASLIALVAGFRSLPLEFLGIPAYNTDLGLAAAALVATVVCLALAIRPLFRQERRGWKWLLAAAIIHLIYSIKLQHAISGSLELALAVYLFFQLKSRYQDES
jgi:hypothetical protein